MAGQAEELGRIIRGEVEEVWSLVRDDEGSLVVRYETSKVAGDEHSVILMSPADFQRSTAPEAIKARLRERS